jgi:hypothetical protein
MKVRQLTLCIAIFLLSCATVSLSRQRVAANGAEAGGLPAGATRCDLSLPLQIDLIPIETVPPGQTTRFQVDVQSGLDPDRISNMWVEYEYPGQAGKAPEMAADRREVRRSGHTRLEFGLVIPGTESYRIRARVMVLLNDGHLISQTATRWINADARAPEDMIGRIMNPDGSGIRVYQGLTVR